MCIDSESEEKDEMPLDNKKKGLHDLLKARGAGPKDASRSQLPPTLPLPPPLSTVGLLPNSNLKKKRKEKETIEEGELVLEKKPKQQKIAKDKGQASSVDSRDRKAHV